MRWILIILLMMLAAPAMAQDRPGTDRSSPMGDRTKYFDKAFYQNAAKTVTFPYYLLAPDNIEPDIKYPLIVVLHGRSGHAYGGYVLTDQILNQGMPAFVVVPVMNQNVKDWTDEHYKVSDPERKRPLDHVAALTRELAAQLPIDPTHIYVTGYSMGGTGTYAALQSYPNLYAAGIAICGAWPTRYARHFLNKPLWIFHGERDQSPPVRYSRKMVEAIRHLDGNKVKYTEYPDTGHDSWTKAYAEPGLWTWLLTQSLPPPKRLFP